VTFIEVHRRRLNAAFGLRWPARSAAQPLLPPVEGLRHGATMQVIATGGKAIYGAPLGILMLEAKFPRIPGDMGNAGTWPFPVLCRVVRGATPVCWTTPGRRRIGARRRGGITTNCGFLSLFQAELAAHVRVPVATSALIQVPWVQAMLPPGRRVGIITVSAGSLTPRHLSAAGVPLDTPFVGTEDGKEFFRVLVRGEKQDMDVALAAADILDAGRTLVARHGDIGAIVLECTNMPPYAFALREALGLPVYDIYSLITWLHAGLRPREFGPPADRATCFAVGDAG
jgi:hypothetical protein